MRGLASLVIAAGLGVVLWAGLSFRASEARVEVSRNHAVAWTSLRMTPEAEVLEVAVPTILSEAEQRVLLNQRLHEMIREGRGARLTDATTLRPAKSQAASGTSGRGYRAPRLDLTTPANIPDNDLDCLTQAIYYEARNESEAGQTAVAEVVMNRVRHPGYPKRVCDVVYQRNSRTCQFTFTCDGSIGRGAVRQAAWSRARSIAQDVLDGRHQGQLPDSSVNYHANYVRPNWGQGLARVRQIGAHIFYGRPLGEGSTPGARQDDQG